jgi:hypothetical protein
MSKQKKKLRPKIFRPGATALIEDGFVNVAVFIGTDAALNGVFVNAEGREIMSRDYDFYNYLPVDEPGIPPGWTRLASKRYGIVDGIAFTDVATESLKECGSLPYDFSWREACAKGVNLAVRWK